MYYKHGVGKIIDADDYPGNKVSIGSGRTGVRPRERAAEDGGGRERKQAGGSSQSAGRRRQLSHISGLIGPDKVLLEDSVPTALFALESQGQIYYD